METKELRIGNWVMNGEIRTMVIGLLSHSYEDMDGDIYPYTCLSGILLSPEILMKCGFFERKHCEDWYINMPYTDTILSYRRKQLRICSVNAMPALHIDCLHLHALQNCFFALTNTELIYKP